MIYITKSAQKYFTKILSNRNKEKNIRIFIKNLNLNYAKCGISFCPNNTIKKNDIEFKFSNFSVFLKKSISVIFKKIEINFVKNTTNSFLTIKSHFKKKNNHLNCKNLFKEIQKFLYNKINTNLYQHNGKVELIEINDKMIAIIKFTGGCQGCSMVKMTLKENIEKKLLKNFPQLNGIYDCTNHFYKKNSYY